MRKAKIFIIYFPIVLVACQVVCNLFGLLLHELYLDAGFYLNTLFGTNVLFAIFMLVFTYSYGFCSVSRWAAIAEMLFAINYLIIQDDNLYNIVFQIIVGCIALIGTFIFYIQKFPLCTLSLLHKFFKGIIVSGSCEKGIERFERDITLEIRKKIIHERNMRPHFAHNLK